MNNKELFFILFILVLAVITWLSMDDFNKRLGMQAGKVNKIGENVNIQEEKINKLVEDKENHISTLEIKRKIGFITV